MNVTNVHAISRMAKRSDPREPMTLTPAERDFDELLRFENAERYFAQSAATRDGEVAELPPRAELSKELAA